MRILVIAPFFYPYNNPRAHRWSVIIKAWAAMGHQIHVLTSVGPNQPFQDKVHPNIHIHRAGYNAPKEAISHLFGTRVAPSGASSGGFLNRVFYWSQTNILEKIYWPDSAFIWYFSARRAVKAIIAEHSFDGIVSVALPFTAHLVGMTAHNLLPKLPWIADMGDPFTLQSAWQINNHALFSRLNFRSENQVLKACTAMTLTNEVAQKMYLNTFKDHASKLKVIWPTLTEDIVTLYQEEAIPLDNNKIHIGFFGIFYKDIRSPEGLLSLLRKLKQTQPQFASQLQIHLAGDIHQSYSHLFDSYADVLPMLKLHGMLPRTDTVRLSMSMNLLLLIGIATDYQLPSKTIDYMYAAKPVINICYYTDEPFRALFDDFAPLCNIHLPFNHDVTMEHVEQFSTFVLTKHPTPKDRRAEVVAQFGAEAIAKQYLALLK